MKRRATACVAALAAAVSIGALGYAVLWGFDLAELGSPVPPAVQAPQGTTKAPPRRKAPMVVAPHPSGEDAQQVRSAGEARSPPFGGAPSVAALPEADETSSLVAVAPPSTPPTPGEDAQRVWSAAEGRSTPFGDVPSVAALPETAETSSLVAVAPPPNPPTPGEDAHPIATSERASAASAVSERPRGDDAHALSDLIPQEAAALPPVPDALPDPEPTASIPPANALPRTVLMPRPPRRVMARDRPLPPPRAGVAREGPLLPPPDVVIVRGVPPVPGDSPGIVRPGPLIIHLPAPARR
jgi:hypothetical protein